MNFHLTSDTHIEMSNYFPDPPVADVGVFAGDIGNVCQPEQLIKFFTIMCDRYKHIIWVLGNHEPYYMDYTDSINKAKQLADSMGIHLMDISLGTDNLELDGVKFWGSTLWTDFKNDDWFVKRKTKTTIRDYYNIKVGDRALTVTETYNINQQTRERINWDADVVITHHAPLLLPHPVIPTDDLSYSFYNTGLEDKIADSNIKIWMYGHTHHSLKTDVNGTSVISNCHGFKSRWKMSAGSNYNPDLIIEL